MAPVALPASADSLSEAFPEHLQFPSLTLALEQLHALCKAYILFMGEKNAPTYTAPLPA